MYPISWKQGLLCLVLVHVLCGSVVLNGCSSAKSAASTALPSALQAAGPLLSSLTSAVPGLSQAQSILGAGSLFGLAKSKMPADQFSQIANAIPGTNELVNEAVKQGLPSALSGLSDVTSFLEKSGISASQVSQLASALGNEVSKKVPSSLADSFMSALK